MYSFAIDKILISCFIVKHKVLFGDQWCQICARATTRTMCGERWKGYFGKRLHTL